MTHKVKINDILLGLAINNDDVIVYVNNENYELIVSYPFDVYAKRYDKDVVNTIDIKPISLSHPGHKELIESTLAVNIKRGIDFYLSGDLDHVTYLRMKI